MKHWTTLLLVVLLSLVACFGEAESTTTDPIKVSMELSNNMFTEPEEITITITVTNVGEQKMPGAVTLYNPCGEQIKAFGSPKLDAGEAKTWTGTWEVTQAQLEAGRITFKIKYSVYDDAGKLINKTKNFSKAIVATNPDVVVTCRASQETAALGESITITWQVENTGKNSVQAFTAHERVQHGAQSALVEETGKIKSVAAGETAEYVFTHIMGEEDIMIRPSYFFTIGQKTYNGSLPTITILCVREDAKEETVDLSLTSSPLPNIILIVDGEVYPLTEEQKLQISEIIR